MIKDLEVIPLSLTQVVVPGPPVLLQALERGAVQLVWSRWNHCTWWHWAFWSSIQTLHWDSFALRAHWMEADCTSQGMGSSSSMSSRSQSLSRKHSVHRLGSAHLGTSWDVLILGNNSKPFPWAKRKVSLGYLIIFPLPSPGLGFRGTGWDNLQSSPGFKDSRCSIFCHSFPIAHSEVTRLPQSYIQSPGYPEQTSLQTKALSSLGRMVITWETEQGRLSRGHGPLRNEFRMLISARARITLHFYRRLKTLRMLQNSLVPKLKTGVGFPVLGERVTWPNCVILKPLGPSLPDMSTYNVTEGKYKCFWKRVELEDWCSDLSLSLGTKNVSNLSKS